jgi:DNA-binding NarL/FixJ family response regulator
MLEPEFDVIAIVWDGRALLETTCKLHPDVVVLDIAMPELNGLDAGEQLKQRDPSIKLVYMTMSEEPDLAAEAFRRGASGYVLKKCSMEELLVAVRLALKGEYFLTPLITEGTVELLLQSAVGDYGKRLLSSRQTEVLQLLAEGKSMKEIAYILEVEPGTIAFHKYQIMKILKIKTNAALIKYAVEHHIIPPR